jgi:hypothetical protein
MTVMEISMKNFHWTAVQRVLENHFFLGVWAKTPEPAGHKNLIYQKSVDVCPTITSGCQQIRE